MNNGDFYVKNKLLKIKLNPFGVLPKYRVRISQSAKGKRQVYTPSKKNASQLSFALQNQITALSGDFTPFLGDVLLCASIRSKKVLRGDSDNYLKQIKDVLQDSRFPIVKNDRQVIAGYCERIEKVQEDSVCILITEAANRVLSDSFAYLSEMFYTLYSVKSIELPSKQKG